MRIRFVLCLLTTQLVFATCLTSNSWAQEAVRQADFAQLETLIGDLVSGRATFEKADWAVLVDRVSSGEFNKNEWFDINISDLVALSLLSSNLPRSEEASEYYSKLKPFFDSRSDVDDEYREAANEVLLDIKVFSLEDKKQGRQNEKKWFEDLNNANQKTKERMVVILAGLEWLPDRTASRLKSLKNIFIDDKTTDRIRSAVIDSIPTFAIGRTRSLGHRESARFFLELYDSGKCSKEHVRKMFKVISELGKW